jgi:hypothetical protein
MHRLSVVVFAVAAAGLGCSTHAPFGAPLPLPQLHQEGTRDRAVCDLLRRQKYATPSPRYRQELPSQGCRVRSLFDNTGRPDGAVLVLLNFDWNDPELPDRPDVGVQVLFDRAGRIVPVFEAANYLNGSSGVVSYTHDGAFAVVHQFGYAGDPDWAVEALHVVPATTTQTPILSLLIGPPQHRFPVNRDRGWAWRARDLDEDGDMEFEIGPALPDGLIEARATYRYSSVSGRYEGPAGSLSGDFYLVEPPKAACNWAVAEQFAQAHGFASTPTECVCQE